MKSFLLTTLALLPFLLPLAPGTVAAQAPSDHRFAPGDTVIVKVLNEPELDTTAVVARDGRIVIGLVGETNVAGMTATEASRALENAFRNGRFLRKPAVSVSVGAIVRKRFTIQGQVGKPGPFFFPDGEQLTLMQAIGFAGGPTRIANLSKVTILRNGQTIKVDAKKLAKQGGADIPLLPGDVINVPEGW